MPYTKTTYTLIQNVGETDSDFMDRVNAFIALELFYFESVGGSFPVPKEDSNASYKGSPPTQPTSDTTYWDVTNTQNRRVVTFSYDNLYYWIYTGATPPLPGPPSPAPSGNIVMWGPGSTLTDGVLTLNTLAPNFTNLAAATVAGEAVEFSQFGSLALGTQLTGLVAGTNTPITATDTILSAFQNLQAQISAGGSAITALTGDVTATGPGSVAATIANNAVTFAKFQNLSGPGVLTGRYSAGSGNMQEITLGSGLSMSGAGVLSATGTGGTVTSVGLSLPTEFSVSGSPVTGSGTLSATWANATAGYFFAGPAGAVPPGTPSFRAMVVSDLPSMTSSDLAGKISDETGSGSLVFGTAPTLSNPTINQMNLTGNISSPAWTTNGIRIKGVAATFTDTTSSGTVATAYTSVLGGNTIAASNVTTFTNYFALYVSDPIAGTNVTLTNKWALGVDSLRVGTSNQLTISTTGVLTATSPVFTTPSLGVATATSINKVTLTQPATGSTLTIADGKTLSINNSITFTGTDGTTMTLPSVSSTLAAIGDVYFTLVFNGATYNPADSTTYYFGANFTSAPGIGATSRIVYIPYDCTLIGYAISMSMTVGSSENSQIYCRIDNTTDVQLGGNWPGNANPFAYGTGLSTNINAGSYVNIKHVHPTYATNPTSLLSTVYLYFKRR